MPAKSRLGNAPVAGCATLVPALKTKAEECPRAARPIACTAVYELLGLPGPTTILSALRPDCKTWTLKSYWSAAIAYQTSTAPKGAISIGKGCCARRPRPNEPQVLAGTIPCPECMGHPVVHRHTPNLLRLFNLDDPLFFKARALFVD